MRAPYHRVTGLCAGVVTAVALGAHPLALLAIPTGLVGGNAPDRIEWLGHHRWCKHRTITHWFLLWATIFVLGGYFASEPWGPALMGYGAGGLVHLCFDVPNIMGVPVFTPSRRIAFRWWKSGVHDVPLSLACLTLAVLAVVWRLHI